MMSIRVWYERAFKVKTEATSVIQLDTSVGIDTCRAGDADDCRTGVIFAIWTDNDEVFK